MKLIVEIAITKTQYACRKCGHTWESKSQNPSRCPKCRSRLWNRERKRPINLPVGVRDRVIELRRKNPCLASSAIAHITGVSRQRVSQLLKESGENTRKWKQAYICNQCDKKYIPKHGNKAIKDRLSKVFCSPECRKQWHNEHLYSTVKCEQCGKEMQVLSSRMAWNIIHRNKKYFFCDKVCMGKWLGGNYHPLKGENRNHNKHRVKISKYHDKIPYIKSELEKGRTLYSLMVELNIPQGNYMHIKKLIKDDK